MIEQELNNLKIEFKQHNHNGLNSFKVDSNNLLKFPKPYANMYIYTVGAGSITVTVASADVYYKLPYNANYPVVGLINKFEFINKTPDPAYFKCLQEGIYKIDWSLSAECANANNEVEASILINSVVNTSFASHANLGSANQPSVLGSSGLIRLRVNDIIQVGLSNHTASNNIKVDHLSLTITSADL